MTKEEKSEKNSLSNESYLYLHPGENPTTSLVSPLLDSGSYHSWSKFMLTALSAKNKLQFVNCSMTELEKNDPAHDSWIRCNNMVGSWLVHFVSPQIQ